MTLRDHITEFLTGGATVAVSTLVAVIQTQFGPDIVAAIGASVASLVVAIEANKKQRDMWQTISVVVSSIAAGWILPGVIVWGLFPQSYSTLLWQAWAGLGFVFGLLGWAITAGILALRARVPGAIAEAANRYLPGRENDPKP